MLIKFKDICEKYRFIPSGVLHVGAHDLEEIYDYMSLGVTNIVWVEANPFLAESGFKKASSFGQKFLQGLIFDQDDIDLEFNITNNMQSSSVLKFSKHKKYHPSVDIVNTIKMKSVRLDTLLEKNKIDTSSIDFINLDIQGVELRALKSLGHHLEKIKYIYTEVNSGEVYENNDLIGGIDDFLGKMGFERKETSMTEFEWGDAFYLRK